jgi:hypothetical protein
MDCRIEAAGSRDCRFVAPLEMEFLALIIAVKSKDSEVAEACLTSYLESWLGLVVYGGWLFWTGYAK